MKNFLKKIRKKLSNKKTILALGSCVTCFILGTMAIIPFFDDKRYISVLEDVKDKTVSVVGADKSLGWDILDNGSVFHLYNKYNDYYFNRSNGVQFTNHYEEYWTTNVLMLGYYSGDSWNLVYRVDELSGFNEDLDNASEYINVTLWKDLSYSSYDFRLAVRYHLGVNDSELTVVPYIKNLGISIPFDIGFGWEMKDIRIANQTGDNIVRLFNGTGFEDIPLNETIDRSFTDMDLNTTINLICTNPPSPFFSRNLYLSWNNTLNYKVTVKSRSGQFNAPVSLFVKVGTLNVGQEKSTSMRWLDSDAWLGISGSELIATCDDAGTGNRLIDALNGTTYWYDPTAHNHWFVLDLGANYTIKKFRGRSDENFDPVTVDIYISIDNVTWGSTVAGGINTWQDTTSWVEVDSTDKKGRYIKCWINSTEPVSYTHLTLPTSDLV